MTDIFRYFIRKNWKEAGKTLTNEDIDGLGIEFYKYLDETLTEEVKDKIIPKTPMDIIMDESILKHNGFHPAYTLHFTDFIKKMKD